MSNVRDVKFGNVTRRKRVVTEFICGRCFTKHSTFSRAQKCAAMPVEPQQFAKGDRVTWREPAMCDRSTRSFRIKATVVGVRRPEPPDEEYNLKWLGGKLTGKHVRQYEVAFSCSCGRARTMLLYAAEMKRL